MNYVTSTLRNNQILLEYKLINDNKSMELDRMSLRFKKRSKLMLFFLIIFSILIYFYYLNTNLTTDGLISNESYFYSIIIDAGSTGSRIHVFKLSKNTNNYDTYKLTLPYRLVNIELFKAVKPGLSAYADDIFNAAKSLQPLLDEALLKVPKKLRILTKISLKATAGLRLISDEKANKIIENVDLYLDQYPFFHTSKYIHILDGHFEGIYSWITLNYALSK